MVPRTPRDPRLWERYPQPRWGWRAFRGAAPTLLLLAAAVLAVVLVIVALRA
jgi:hypothetical protein